MDTASKAGLTGTSLAGGGLTVTTATLSAPTANLGGYATAQIVAGKVGMGGGPALSVAIKAVGGPLVAGTIASVGVGVVIWGAFKFVGWLASS